MPQICAIPTNPLYHNGLWLDGLITPTLKAAGSNPVGHTKRMISYEIVLFYLWVSVLRVGIKCPALPDGRRVLFLSFEGIEPICLQFFHHVPHQLEACREAHQLGFNQQRVLCVQQPQQLLSLRSVHVPPQFLLGVFDLCVQFAVFLPVETLLQSLHVVVHRGTSFLVTTTHTTTRHTKLLLFSNVLIIFIPPASLAVPSLAAFLFLLKAWV